MLAAVGPKWLRVWVHVLIKYHFNLGNHPWTYQEPQVISSWPFVLLVLIYHDAFLHLPFSLTVNGDQG